MASARRSKESDTPLAFYWDIPDEQNALTDVPSYERDPGEMGNWKRGNQNTI